MLKKINYIFCQIYFPTDGENFEISVPKATVGKLLLSSIVDKSIHSWLILIFIILSRTTLCGGIENINMTGPTNFSFVTFLRSIFD